MAAAASASGGATPANVEESSAVASAASASGGATPANVEGSSTIATWVKAANYLKVDCCKESDLEPLTALPKWEENGTDREAWMLQEQHAPLFWQWYPISATLNGIRYCVEYVNIARESKEYGKYGTMFQYISGDGHFDVEGEQICEWSA